MGISFLVFLLSGLFALAQGSQWTSGGPFRSIGAVVIDSKNPRTLYVSFLPQGSLDAGSVFKSTDSGASWTSTGGFARTVAIDPSNPSTLYAGAFGVSRSLDGGTTWQDASEGLPKDLTFSFHPIPVDTLVIDPTAPTRLFALVGDASQARTLYVSTDSAGSWKSANLPVAFSAVTAIAVSQTTGTIYVAAYNGMIRSSDGGASWTAIGGCSGCVRQIVVDPVTSSTVYVVTDSGIFRSEDAGKSWERRGSEVAEFLLIDPRNPSTLYAAAMGQIWKSRDSGLTWNATRIGVPPVGLSPTISSMAIDPATPTTVYAGSSVGQGFFKTVDGGGSWDDSNRGLPKLPPNAIATDPLLASRLYAGAGSSIYRSDDFGNHWTMTAFRTNIGVRILAVDPATSGTVYAGFSECCGGRRVPPFLWSGSLEKSLDGGASWKTLPTDPPVAFAIDPQNTNTLYASVRKVGFAPGDNIRSTDGGTTWISLGPGPDPGQLIVDPFASNTLYALSAGVFKSIDGGQSWNPSSTGLTSLGVNALVLDPKSKLTLYACTQDGAFKSTDGGSSWSQTGFLGRCTTIAINPRNSSAVYLAAETAGVFQSADGGASWEPMNARLSGLSVTDMAIDSAGIFLHATTPQGVFDVRLPGQTRVVPAR